MVEWMDMFIRVQFRDFEITSGRPPIDSINDFRTLYWATIYFYGTPSTYFYKHLSKEGSLDTAFNAEIHRFYSLEEVESALSLYYNSPIKLDIPRTHKELV
jgi:hypothetical protein